MMLRSTLALAAAVAALAAPVASASSASTSQVRVYFPRDCQHNAYKPRSIVVTCADANFVLKRVRYSTYGPKGARGTATASINSCTPSCVAGKFHDYKVTFTMGHLSRNGQCGDVQQFQRLTIRFTGSRPKGEKRTLTQRFPCAIPPS